MKLGVSKEGTVLNECAKFQKKLPYGSRACHWLQWYKNNNNTYNNNRFPPDGGTLNIAAGSNGGFLQRLRTREKCIFCTICHCIEKSMLQTYQWDIQFEMQYCQDPQGFKLRRGRGLGQATMSWNGVCASWQVFGVSGGSLCLWELGQAARGAKEERGRHYTGNGGSN